MVAYYPSQYESFLIQSRETLRSLPSSARRFIISLFPILSWLPRYALEWITNDLIAGFTCGIVVIPIAFANARLASLPIQYGLYTCFVAIAIYPFFGTSKDVSVGATSVLSTVIGQLISNLDDDSVDPIVWATAVTLVAGVLQLLFGLLGLGIIVDFIPSPVIQGFITGASIAVSIGQLPALFGITGIDSNEAPYLVLIDVFKNLRNVRLDMAFGVSAMIMLAFLKYLAQYLSKTHPKAKWIRVCRNAAVVAFFTIISYLVNRNLSSPAIRIVTSVPSGFNYIKVPSIPHWSSVLGSSITIVIVGTIEHMAIVKSFGRINGYNAVPGQELIALGVGNMVGSFFGAFPATGSFSRSAISSQCGSKSPLAAFFTSSVVLMAIYFLMPLLYYIPLSVLSAVLISAIVELIATPSAILQLINVDFLDFVAFLLVTVCTLFMTIERSIYVAVGFAILVILIRLARPNWAYLVRSESSGLWIPDEEALEHSTIARTPPPGLVVIRIEEGMIYPNATYLSESIKSVVYKHTSRAATQENADRKWCDTTHVSSPLITKHLPPLRALIFDFSSVNNIDYTGLQMLVDLQRDLSSFTGCPVALHFAHVKMRYMRKLIYFIEHMVHAKDSHHASEPEDQDSDADQLNFEDFVHFTLDDAIYAIEKAQGDAVFELGERLDLGQVDLERKEMSEFLEIKL